MLGNIGYLTGNVNFMEGNMTDMDYAYGGPPSFPMWKPHYFPRGEAPPPYEEAVAISQAEQLSMATAAAEQVQHYQIQSQQQPHVSSTTNLINININSGGNITATAINHQTPPEQNFPSVQHTSQIVSCHNQDYQHTPPRLQIASNAICLQGASPLNAIVHQASQQQYIPISVSTVSTIPSNVVECNYKNCYLNSSQKRVQPKIQVQTQTQTQSREPRSICEESQALVRKSPEDLASDKTPISRRNHRSIPRQFSISSDTNCAETQTMLSHSTKPTCQCPIQHTPMHLSTNRNHSTNINTQITAKIPKSVKSTSTSTAGLKSAIATSNKITTISKQIGDIEDKAKPPICMSKIRVSDSIASSSKSSMIQSSDSNPTLPPKMCRTNIQKRNSSYYRSNLSNKMSLKSYSNAPKMDLNIPVTASYSGLVNIEKTQNHVSEAKSYMLSKHQNSKASIIDDVVSKVPAVITIPSISSRNMIEPTSAIKSNSISSNPNLVKCATLPKLLKISNKTDFKNEIAEAKAMSMTPSSTIKHPASLPHESSLDDEYFSECENCKTAQSTKYLIGAETLRNEIETMTLHRKLTNEVKSKDHFRISCTLPSNSKKNVGVTTINHQQWFAMVPATSDDTEVKE